MIWDQLLKWWMIKFHPSFVFDNQGVVFGLIENQIVGYSLLLVGLLVLGWMIKNVSLSHIAYRLSLILIIAGAFSNIVDRIFRGYVVDYLNFFNLNHFNLADVFILTGAILYLWQSLKKK